MKKTYTKPNLMFLSLSPNTQLCGSCAVNLMEDTDLANKLMQFFRFGINDGVVSEEDFDGVFGQAEACSKKIFGYCKFTSGGPGIDIVAWS